MNKEPYPIGTIHFQIICYSDISHVIYEINENKVVEVFVNETDIYYLLDDNRFVTHSNICLYKKEALKRIITKINELYDYE